MAVIITPVSYNTNKVNCFIVNFDLHVCGVKLAQ